MAKFIHENKLYDTEKAEVLCTGEKQYEQKLAFFDMTIYPTYLFTLYRTKNNNYFEVHKEDYDTLYMLVRTEAEAKAILMRHDYDKYCELFGALEEA